MEEQRNLARRRQLNSEKTFYFDILWVDQCSKIVTHHRIKNILWW
jgi:hypothetical protein